MRILLLLASLGSGSVLGAELEVPAGTLLAVELVDPVHTGKNKPGDVFRARVSEGVWVRGAVAVPPGTTARGVLSEVEASGRVKGRSRLSMTLASLEMEGRSYAVHTDTLSYTGEPHTGKNWGSWLAGALQGAVYGVLFGGKEGAVIGAGAGAAAGGASGLLKGKQDIEFPQGAKLLFEVVRPFSAPAFPAPAAQEAPKPEAPKPAQMPAEKPAEAGKPAS